MGIAINSQNAPSPVPTTVSAPLSPAQQQATADMFQHVLTYSVVGIWDMAHTAMNSIDASTTAQHATLNMDQQFEYIAENWSNSFAALSDADLAQLKADSGDSGKVSIDTQYINAHTQNSQTVNTFFSGIVNAGSNSATQFASDSQIMNSNMTTINGFFDFLSQLLASN